MESSEPNSPSKPFQCTSCSKSYSRRSNLKEHIQNKHTEGECKSYSCIKCLDNKQLEKSFATKTLLIQHNARIHGPHRFKCQVCFKTFHNSSSFRKHQRIHIQNIEKGHKCELCSKILGSKHTLQNHLFSSHSQKIEGVKYFACEICPSEFSIRSHLESHVLREHVVDKAYECGVCSKKFVDQETLEKHFAEHNKPIQYFCDICSTGFKATRNLICHLGIAHLKFFYCRKCCRSYGTKPEFDQHSDRKTSSEQKLAFNCTMCGETFDSQCNLDIHTNSHLTEIKFKTSNDVDLKNKSAETKPGRSIAIPDLTEQFQCELCSKSFDRNTYFRAHRKIVHPYAEWPCNFQKCSKRFKKWSELKLHKLTHLGTKPFVCSLCRKAFYHAKQLEDHELSHLKDKNHKCEMCPKSFAKPSQLKVHVANNHGGPKPFECPVKNCGKTWANNRQLNSHLVSHETDRPFQCDICITIKAFKSLRELQMHERRVHLKSIIIQGGNNLKDKIIPKMTKNSDALVYICCSNNCSFETVEEKNVALHYNLKHGLPKVVISPNCLPPSSSLLQETPFETCKSLIQKQYKCKICSVYIKLSSNFSLHQLTHSKETPFECSRCLTRFKYQRSLRIHMRKMHNNNGAVVGNN